MANPIAGSCRRRTKRAASQRRCAGRRQDTNFLQTLDGVMNQAGDAQSDAQSKFARCCRAMAQDLHSAR